MPYPTDGKFEKVRDALRTLGRSRREIAAVYLFGSSATGKAGPLSDLDVAVLIDETRVKPRKFFDLRLGFITDAMESCRRFDVDVILLNEAPPLLAYEVVSVGSLLYERNHAGRVDFEARTLQRYLDLKPFLETSRKYLKRRLKNGTFGG